MTDQDPQRSSDRTADTPLNLAWEAVNALGGSGSTAEELAYIYGIERALEVIEHLGGVDPLPLRAALPSTASDITNAALLSASEMACYRWPDNADLRQAFCDGAAHIALGVVPLPSTDKRGLQ